MSIGVRADRSTVAINEPIRLAVVTRNDSWSTVEAMRFEINEEITWYANGYRERRRKTIARIVVSGSQFRKLHRIAEKREELGRGPAAIGEAAQRDLEQLLAAGVSAKFKLSVPDTCNTTMLMDNIEVKHSLCVSLETPVCVNTPEVWTPLRVQSNAGGLGQRAVEAVTYATTMPPVLPYAKAVEVNPNENVKPVSVPQSAVRLHYSNDLPELLAPAKT